MPLPITASLALTLESDADVVPALDRAYLGRFTLGNLALEREVLGLFAGQAPLYLQRLLEAETPQAWVEAAHTLKGASAGLGINRVARLAAAAEGLDVFSVAEGETLVHARAEAVDALRRAIDQALGLIRELSATAE